MTALQGVGECCTAVLLYCCTAVLLLLVSLGTVEQRERLQGLELV